MSKSHGLCIRGSLISPRDLWESRRYDVLLNEEKPLF